MSRRVIGSRKFQRILANLSDNVRSEVVKELDRMGDVLLPLLKRHVAVRTGALRAGMTKEIGRKGLSLRVGLIGQAKNKKLFYGRWIEFGRKGGTVLVGSTRGGRYYPRGMRVGALPPRPFMYSPTTDLRKQMNVTLRHFWRRVLVQSMSGVDDA